MKRYLFAFLLFLFLPTITKAGWYIEDGGILHISGDGPMEDYSEWEYPAPWGTDFTEVYIEEGITHIGNYAFYNCENITNVSLCEGLESIGDYAFYGCKNAWFSLPYTLTDIGVSAFQKCERLNLYHSSLPSVSTIKSYSFAETGLQFAIIPSSVTTIENGAFWGCKNLSVAWLSGSVSSIGQGAFY